MQSWELLKDKLQEIEPEANLAAIKKKIEHMRSAFNREHKKVKESKRTGAGANDVHVPNLWYYNLLLPIFDKKDEQSRCGVDTLSSDEESRPSEHEKGRKKLNILEIKKRKLIDTAQELLQSDNRKENQKEINSFGLYVGEQLDQVETFQRQVAEKLISDVLFLAKTGNLNFDSRIETKRSRNFPIFQMSSSPQYTRLSPSPNYIQSSSSPYHIQSLTSPQQSHPSPSPNYIQSSPSPYYIQPSPSPSPYPTQPSPHPTQPSPSPHPTKPTPHPTKPSSSPHPTKPSPSPHPTQTSPSHPTIPSHTNRIIYEGPASAISEFVIFEKDK
ncbi:unnamed protein product [Parnassius apollo]|uniref:(apollo) hypothetical protein n=1 Tax=Parnassius apollo TaxID=110799 RepID=A0A8S3WUS0_PARAO|nr:unnamed protein product [Parnassius apollo]